jgi:hypothetical protein
MESIKHIENWFSTVNAPRWIWFYRDCETVLDVLEKRFDYEKHLKEVIAQSPKFNELACNELLKMNNFHGGCMQRYLAYLNQFA